MLIAEEVVGQQFGVAQALEIVVRSLALPKFVICTWITEFMKQVFPMFLRPLAPPTLDDDSSTGLSSFSCPF